MYWHLSGGVSINIALFKAELKSSSVLPTASVGKRVSLVVPYDVLGGLLGESVAGCRGVMFQACSGSAVSRAPVHCLSGGASYRELGWSGWKHLLVVE